jgi:hypothetical protein
MREHNALGTIKALADVSIGPMATIEPAYSANRIDIPFSILSPPSRALQ